MGKHYRRLLVGALLAVVALAVPGGGAVTEPTVTFTASGDFAATSATSAVLETIDALDRDAHFALGDLSYGVTGQEQAWCDFVTARVGAGHPFELLAGNHESNGQNGNINDFSACLPNQLPGLVGTYGRQYYVDVPAANPLVRYVMISPALPYPDSTWSYAPGTPRYDWTVAAIDGARAASIPWVVVGMHKPCLSVGQYSCEPGAEFVDMLVSKRVDLVLSGHEHNYQRSKQVATGPSCPTIGSGTYSAGCVADADSDFRKGAGTVFAVVGTSGTALRDIVTTDPEMAYFSATSGLNMNPTYGTLDVDVTADRLSASFVRAAGGTFTDAFEIVRATPGQNQPPTSTFSAGCQHLTCSFDGSGSSDPDGTVVGHHWTFGDGTTGSGATTSHTYSGPGTYTVQLVTTDDGGATTATTKDVTVTAPPPPSTLASDDFSRTVTGGFGSAVVGGTWSTVGPAADFSVSGGVGRIVLSKPGSGRTVRLPSVSSAGTDMRVVLTTDKPGSGGGQYLSLLGREVPNAGSYRSKILVQGGTVRIGLTRAAANGTETNLTGFATVSGVDLSAGGSLNVRLKAVGTSPTTLTAKVWPVGTAEPTAWSVSATDSTANLQAPGSIGASVYLSSSATNAPITISLDDLSATVP